MSVHFSVIVLVGAGATPPKRLVLSLDQQSLAYADFEVVFADLGRNEHLTRRLTQLCGHRPNMRVVTGSGQESPAQVLNDALGVADGEYVLFLEDEEVLLPEALERLHRVAAAKGADVVVGRDAGRIPRQLFADSPELSEPVDAAGMYVGYRTSFLRSTGLRFETDASTPHDERFRASALGSAGAVAALGSYPCSRDVPDGGEQLVLADSSTTWHGDALTVSTTVAAGPGSVVPETALTRLVLRSSESGVQYPLESRVSAGEGMLTVEAEVRPASAALGESLGDGGWQVWVEMVADAFYASAPVEPCDVQSAIIDGRVVSHRRRSPVLELQIGVTNRGIVRGRPADTTITDSATGTLLKIALPNVHVHGSGEIAGRIALDRLVVPARIVFDAGVACVEGKASGLAGHYAISTQFGTNRLVPTGLTLVVSGLGEMSVVRTRPQNPASGAKPEQDAARPESRVARSIQSIRRGVPDSAVGSLARIPGTRRIYQRLVRH